MVAAEEGNLSEVSHATQNLSLTPKPASKLFSAVRVCAQCPFRLLPVYTSRPIKKLCEHPDDLQVQRVAEQSLCDISTTSTDGWTALHFSARQGHLPLVNYLLKNSVDIDAVTKVLALLPRAAARDTLRSCCRGVGG